MPAFGVPRGSGDHHCWIFDEPAAFHSRVRAFLSEGLRANHRVWYAGEESEDVLLGHVRATGFDDAIARGAARVISIADIYAGASGASPQAQADAFAGALRASLADGYSGMRVAADATSLAAGGSWIRYEHLVDRFMVDHPFAGLCGFDGRRLDSATAAELECLHPVTNTGAVGFRVTACSPAADRIALTGELDCTNHELLVRALDIVDLEPAGGQVVIDASGLTFIDHRTVLVLARYARDRGATLVLRDPQPGARHIAELLAGGCFDSTFGAMRMEWSR